MTTEMNTRLAAFFALFATQVAGCEGGTPDFLGDPAMISGRIANWTKGRGYTLEATQYYIGTLLATADIEADGSFRITMPPLAKVRTFEVGEQFHGTPPACRDGSVSISTDKYAMAAVLFGTRRDQELGHVTFAGKSDESHRGPEATFLYVDRPLRQHGALTCSVYGVDHKLSFDISYLPGLNRVFESFSPIESYLIVGKHTGTVPADAEWLQK